MKSRIQRPDLDLHGLFIPISLNIWTSCCPNLTCGFMDLKVSEQPVPTRSLF